MKCPKCGSEMNVQLTTETQIKKKHSFLYWCTVGWFLEPLLWFFLTIPMFIFKLFRPKKYRLKQKTVKNFACNTCGYVKRV